MGKQEPRVVVATAPEEGGGTLSISHTVLAEIVVTEAAATDGVALPHETGPKGKGLALEDVRVQLDGREAVFEVHIGVRHGLRMPEVADALRQRIADAVRAKTGYTARAVHIIVERVLPPAPEPAAP